MSLPSSPLSKKRPFVLIVDDDPNFRELFADDLTDTDVDTITSNKAAEAFELLRTKPVDVVFSDINMPIMSGLELLEKCNANGIFIPFVFLTGFGSQNNIIHAVRLGAADFLEKPSPKAVTHQVLKRVLGIAARQQAIELLLDEIVSAHAPATRHLIEDLRRQIGSFKTLNHRRAS